MISNLIQIKENFLLKRSGVFRFQQKNKLSIQFGPYLLKTAESSDELIESFKLRNEVFSNEFRGLNSSGLDFDRYDTSFDHLLIIHLATSKVVGTYRVNCSQHPLNSYSSNEFQLEKILCFEGPYMELGRACIHKDHRRGAVISLLWRGIAQYMKMTDSQVLFGCSSLKIVDSRRAALVYRLLQIQGATIENGCEPQNAYKFDDFQSWAHFYKEDLTLEQLNEAQELIPSLLKSYLNLGAKIFAPPAFDRDFGCLDFLTILKRSDLSHNIEKKFKLGD